MDAKYLLLRMKVIRFANLEHDDDESRGQPLRFDYYVKAIGARVGEGEGTLCNDLRACGMKSWVKSVF